MSPVERDKSKKIILASCVSLLLFLQLTQELDSQSVGQLTGPVGAEDVSLVLTLGTLEDAHVLNQAEDLQRERAAVTGSLSEGLEAGFNITGTLTFLNISAPLRASSRAMS